MFIGRGFDFDGDGNNDIFVAGKLGPLPDGCVTFILSLLGGGLMVAVLFVISGLIFIHIRELTYAATCIYWLAAVMLPIVLLVVSAGLATAGAFRVSQSLGESYLRGLVESALVPCVIAIFFGDFAITRCQKTLADAREAFATLTPSEARFEVVWKLRKPWYTSKNQLDSIRMLSPDAAAVLAASGCVVSLGGLTTISPEIAEALAGCEYLSLDGLTTMSLDVAQALVKCPRLSLGGLTTISPEIAEALAGCEDLSLDGLTTMSLDVAQALVKCPRLSLNGVETVSVEVAETLSRHGRFDAFSRLSLAGLASLSPKAVKLLRNNSSIQLPEKFCN